MKHVEVHYPQGDAILVYDTGQTAAEKVIEAVLDRRPDLEIIIEANRPLP